MTNHQIKSLKNEQSTLSINSMFKYLFFPTHNSCFCPNQVVRSVQTCRLNATKVLLSVILFTLKKQWQQTYFGCLCHHVLPCYFDEYWSVFLFFCQTCQIMFDHSFLPDILFCATDVWQIDHYSYVALSFCTLYLRSIVARYCTLCSWCIALEFALGGLHCIFLLVDSITFCS